MQIRKGFVAAAGAALCVTCTGIAGAEDKDADRALSLLSKTVPLNVLQAQRGRAQPDVLAVMGLDGVVQDNVAIHTISGKNIITNGSFANSNGMSNVIQNSGNNVLIQNATILMLDVR
jgi:hypothetical protein